MYTLDDFDDDQHMVVTGNGLHVYPKGKVPAKKDVPEDGGVTSVGQWKFKERLHRERGMGSAGNAAGQVPGRQIADMYLYEVHTPNKNHISVGGDGLQGIYGEGPTEHTARGIFGGQAHYGKDDPKNVLRTLKIRTSPDQGQKAIDLIRERVQKPGKYSLIGDSCVDAGRDVLRGAGVQVPQVPTIYLKFFFNSMRQFQGENAKEYNGYVPAK